jgi:uncharacterized phosphosugar-binding protein
VHFETYITELQALLERIKVEQSAAIAAAGRLVADALVGDGVIHTFGTGHSHLIADEAFFRAGGIAAINPILDERLVFLKGALESTRAERVSGFAKVLIEQERIGPNDVAILISNSGRNNVPVEMALEMKTRGVKVIAITSIAQSSSSVPLHSSGKRLFELADLTIDNCVPPGDALLKLPGLGSRIGPSSTVAGAAIINSIMIEAVAETLGRGYEAPVLPSANIDGVTERQLKELLMRYQGRIRYLDLEEAGTFQQ